ncbi:MAG: hypothetical protein K0S53_553 [Bacteroidetes bacterium]|jgi:hypothetical protein|nr:hypothetical protein [Bacteroidota bacterium]
MDVTNNNPAINPSVILTDQIKKHLIETSKWSKFLSILGFIGLGLMVLGAIVILVVGVSFGSYMGGGASGALGASMIALLYLVMAIVYFFPCYYLFKSSTGIQNGIYSNNQELLNSGFESLKSHYKFIGIMMIVILSMYVLIMVFALLALAFR